MAGKVLGGVAQIQEAGDFIGVGKFEKGAGLFEVFADLAGMVVVDGADAVGIGGGSDLIDQIGDFAPIGVALVEAADGRQVAATQLLHGAANLGEEIEVAGDEIVDAG